MAGRHACIWASTLLCAASAARAADKAPPDADLLEFLGSLDAGGTEWRDFLGSTNLDGAAARKPATAPPVKAPPPKKPDQKAEQKAPPARDAGKP